MSGDVEESQDSMPNSAKYIDTASIMAGPGEHGCPRCGGQVFHAEQMFSKGNIYHKVGECHLMITFQDMIAERLGHVSEMFHLQ